VVSGTIDIDPESLAQAGASLAALAEQMATDVQQLQTAVTGSGNPWGGDETGTIFAGLYNAVLGHALESLTSYVEQVGYAAAGLAQQARSTAQTDAAAGTRIDDAGAGLGTDR
jgi:hypothetical protein